MTAPLTLIVRLAAKPEHAETLGEGLCAMIAPTLAEEGCLGYVVHRDNADPTVFIVYETWASAAALDYHFAQPYTAALFARAAEVLAKDAEMTYATVVDRMTGGRDPL